MRKKVFSAAFACGLLAVLAATTAYAQMPGTTLHATIPFDFNVRGQVLPAGNYEIRRLTDSLQGLEILSVDDRQARAIFETESVQAREATRKGEIVFHRYGADYFLADIFAGGDERGREVVPTRQERHLRREMARNEAQPESVALTLH